MDPEQKKRIDEFDARKDMEERGISDPDEYLHAYEQGLIRTPFDRYPDLDDEP